MGPTCSTRSSERWRGGRTPRRIPAMWVLAVILLVALMIPIAAILVDSPLGRSIARRLEGQGDGGGGDVKALERRIDVLESELPGPTRALSGVHHELQVVPGPLGEPRQKRSRRCRARAGRARAGAEA